MLGSYADKFGAKWMTGVGVLLPALFNALIPVLADIHYSLVIVMRILIGAFHGVIYACVFSMFSKWFPQSEKILAISGTIFFGNFGGVITMPIAGYLCKIEFLGGWPTVFYLTSIIHIVWFGFWYFLVSNSPEEDPNITDYELKYIIKNNPQSRNLKNVTIPWKAIFTSKPVWASILTKMSGSFGYYILCTKMPTYLDGVFGMAIQSNSWFNSMMYGVLCVTNITGGPLSNWVRSRNWFSQTRNRKNFHTFGKLYTNN
jgi:ACS family sodium-dependent inorganic phosphate cotransporter-like MFS transporter 5